MGHEDFLFLGGPLYGTSHSLHLFMGFLLWLVSDGAIVSIISSFKIKTPWPFTAKLYYLLGSVMVGLQRRLGMG